MKSDPAAEAIEFLVAPDEAGQRLDAVLARRYPERSRVALGAAVAAGQVLLAGQPAKPSAKVRAGQAVQGALPPRPRAGPTPEDTPLTVLYEDEHLVAVDKPAGMVVHPAKGHWSGTLAAALAFHCEQLSGVGGPTRPGIVHRLDRDTSGVILAAKSDFAHLRLAEQFAARSVEKEYLALTAPAPERDRDLIDQPIGPHPHQREKMAIRAGHPASRPAQTFFEVRERFPGFGLLRVQPRTGRTHQIRLHLAHAGAPVLCDRLYGGRARITRGELLGGPPAGDVLLERQALHAQRLRLRHPATGAEIELTAPPPADMQAVLEVLRRQ